MRKMASERRGLSAGGGEFVGKAFFQGRMYKVGGYPGALSSDDPRDKIHGELYRLHDPHIVFLDLDQYEECGEGFPEPTEYIRRREKVTLMTGDGVYAWIYLYNRSTKGLDRIESGSFIENRYEQGLTSGFPPYFSIV